MTATEARALSERNAYKSEAIEEGIKDINEKIKEHAAKGDDKCCISFYHYPGAYKDFIAKHGINANKNYKVFNIEAELKEYFTKPEQGYTFRYVTNGYSGFWEICW